MNFEIVTIGTFFAGIGLFRLSSVAGMVGVKDHFYSTALGFLYVTRSFGGCVSLAMSWVGGTRHVAA